MTLIPANVCTAIVIPSQSRLFGVFLMGSLYIICIRYNYKYYKKTWEDKKTHLNLGNNAAVMLHIGRLWLCGYKLAHPFSSGSSCLGVITHTYMLSSHWFSVGCFYIIIIFCVLHQELRSCVVETHPRRLVRWDGWQFFFFFKLRCFLKTHPNHLYVCVSA